ncbi:uncharacterized protein MELLADRAFT_111276 [Melampsora larici-populina 98AG31]|uniref:Uncharacterized protein n=1 Tax=Melampsora larici-populina (strain 98AG31 / pathotype 3-4-7) TaxID=747676 RepID=F4S2K9_MELLP|nr:uncharacterized protein MELLADRAFT_111276 [Melampsora larici-populina 98AG31]EGG01021.1 hypothetical protein MELLADRAFT_111276 [Melampsora larici-populina 98AG31]
MNLNQSGTSELLTSENVNSEEDNSMHVERSSETTDVPMDWSSVTNFDGSASSQVAQSSGLDQGILPGPPSSKSTVPRKRGRPRGTHHPMNDAKRAKIVTSIETSSSVNPDPSIPLESEGASNCLSSSEHISVPSPGSSNVQHSDLRRSSRIQSMQSQSTSNIATVVRPVRHHLVEVAERFGPPPYTGTMFADIDKTMTQTYNRRGLFKAVLNSCPTFLSRVDARIREEVIEELTETPKTRWSKATSLNRDTYDVWLHHLNEELNQRYGKFANANSIVSCGPALSTTVETTKLLKISGKNYTSNHLAAGKGNSAIEYHNQGQRRFGYIQYAFRTQLIETVFLVVDQFTQLNASDSRRDCFVSHPRLQAAIVYSKIERSAVIDMRDLMGHVIVLPYPPGHLGISHETLGIVGLRNIISADADSTTDW